MAFDLRNCFICKACGQYNGFTSSGDYNREIPEQHYVKLNPVTNCVFSEENVYDLRSGNGLCYACNRNQELKVLQLAAFVPENEETFDLEVDQYRTSLEKAYRLCARCEHTLKRTINQVKSRIVNRNYQGKVKGFSPSGAHWSANSLLWVGFCFACLNLLSGLLTFRVSTSQLQLWIGDNAADVILKTLSYLLALKAILLKHLLENPLMEAISIYWSVPWQFLTSWISLDEEKSHDLREIFNISATLATVMLIVTFNGRKLGTHACLLLLWSLMTLLHNHTIFIGEPISTDYLSVMELSLGFSTFLLAYYALTASPTFKNDDLNRSFHRICPEELVTNDESDLESEDLEVSSQLNSTLKSHHSPPPMSVTSSRRKTSPSSVHYNSAMSLNNLSLNDTFVRHRGTASPSVTNPFLTHLNLDRSRRSLISPPRLNQEMVAEPSWVAGGFWTTSSPTKNLHNAPAAMDFIPINSRTSSQSSGFESQAPFSRENSVTKELFDRPPSVFSEPLFKPQPVYPTPFVAPRTSPSLGDTFFANRRTNSLYSAPAAANNWRRPQVLGQRGSIFNFKKFGNDLAQF